MYSRTLNVVYISLAVASIVGCSTLRYSPKSPKFIAKAEDNSTFYTVSKLTEAKTAYDAEVAAGDFAEAKVIRDDAAYAMIADIEWYYRQFEEHVFRDKNLFDTSKDQIDLALDFTITIVGGERAKTVLGAVATAVEGSHLSLDKNLFREKTSEILLKQMRASRTVVKNRIEESLATLDVSTYPFGKMRSEIYELFYAGTIHSALLRASEEAGKEAVEARERTEEIHEKAIQRKVTADEAVAFAAIRSKLNELYKISPPQDSISAMATVLNRLGVPIPTPVSPPNLGTDQNNLYDEIEKKIIEADADVNLLPALVEALGIN